MEHKELHFHGWYLAQRFHDYQNSELPLFNIVPKSLFSAFNRCYNKDFSKMDSVWKYIISGYMDTHKTHCNVANTYIYWTLFSCVYESNIA